MRITAFLMVALGGGLGACGRYAVSLIPVRTDFPLLTLLTNLAGALLIGFIAGAGAGWGQNAVLFWKTGVCGGFTTFSAFSLEAWKLLGTVRGILYIALSVGLCLAGVALGALAGRRFAGSLIR